MGKSWALVIGRLCRKNVVSKGVVSVSYIYLIDYKAQKSSKSVFVDCVVSKNLALFLQRLKRQTTKRTDQNISR